MAKQAVIFYFVARTGTSFYVPPALLAYKASSVVRVNPLPSYLNRQSRGTMFSVKMNRPCFDDAHEKTKTHRSGLGSCVMFKKGVAEGTRTPNPQNHNLMLYRLSYSHREDLKV